MYKGIKVYTELYAVKKVLDLPVHKRTINRVLLEDEGLV